MLSSESIPVYESSSDKSLDSSSALGSQTGVLGVCENDNEFKERRSDV
uniref:Uncharacterized protein n=1 Tax=Moniliophthora roreri TaxID=221103 RepID=A0A0W0FMA6_MONRR